MLGRLMPREGKFFDLFIQHADLCVKGAKEMVALMTNFDDLENRAHLGAWGGGHHHARA